MVGVQVEEGWVYLPGGCGRRHAVVALCRC